MIQGKFEQLKKRLEISLITIPLVIALIFFSHLSVFQPFFTAFLSLLIGIALWEYYHIAEEKGFVPLVSIGILCSIAYVFSVFLSLDTPEASFLPMLTFLVCLIGCFLSFFRNGTEPLANLAITIFGLLYLVVPLTTLLQITYFSFPVHAWQDGRWWLFYLILLTKITDIGGYFLGKIFGKKLLAPNLSPKKTIAGAIGGLAAALITSLLFWLFSINFLFERGFTINLWQSIVLGLSIGILAIIGDLAESLLKRDAGVKDSNQLPGLGGILDMVDSLVFTAPMLYLFLKIHF